MTDFNDKLNDPELRRMIQQLPQRQVGPEFTSRVIDEALASLQSDQAPQAPKWSDRILGWLTGWNTKDLNGNIPVASFMARVTVACCAVIGIGLWIYQTSQTVPSSVKSASTSAAGNELAAVSREVAALESVFHYLDDFSSNADSKGTPDSPDIGDEDKIPWIQDFDSIQAISSEAATADEELLDLFGDSIR